jgi:hypothetical protein
VAFNFEISSGEFLNAYRNGEAFDENVLEVSTYVRGNVGDSVQVNTVITVEVIVNETESLTFNYNSTTGQITSGVNFVTEGLFIGATVDVIQGLNSGESTVENITGAGFTTLFLDTTALTFLSTGAHTDIVIRLKDAPTYSRFKYGLIREDVVSSSESNYASPLDGNPQAYYRNPVTGSFTDMIRLGTFVSWDLTDNLQIKFVGTTGDYFHEYELTHTFKILPYKDGEQDNLITLVHPEDLAGLHTYKYAFSLVLGFSSAIIGEFTSLGFEGKVGYYNENYNGQANIFTLDSIDFTNDSDTGTIEVTETTSVSAVITCNPSVFAAGQRVIVGVYRCAFESEYSNTTETFSDAFTFETLLQDEGQPAVDGTIITQLLVTLDGAGQITVDFDLDYTTAQQNKVTEGDRFGIYFTVANQSLDVDDENQVNLRYTNLFTKNNNVPGLLFGWSPSYYDANAAYAGDRVYTDQKCWDGDLVGHTSRVSLLQYNNGSKNKITKLESRLVLTKSQDTDPQLTPDDYVILWSKPMPLTPNIELTAGGYVYQIVDYTIIDSPHLPPLEDLNRTEAQSVPTFPAGFQAWIFQTSIPRIPWRDFISNPNIPAEFFDETEPNDNLNQKTSNYSGVNGWDVYHEIYAEVTFTGPDVQLPSGFIAKANPIITPYHLRSDEFEVVAIGDDGNPSVVWDGVITILDATGDEAESLSTTQYREIVCEFTHEFGVLSAQDVWGMIWIEKNNSTQAPYQLHTDKDWTVSGSFLQPSDTLDTGNTQFVEISFDTDLVTLICQTSPGNLEAGIEYNIYARLGKKTN